MTTRGTKIFTRLGAGVSIALAIMAILFASHGGQYFWREVWFVFEIFVLTFFTRTVLWRSSLSVFLKGLYIGGGLSILFNGLMEFFSPDRTESIFFGGFVVGFSEELFKMVPVLIIVYLLYKRDKRAVNFSDWLWLSTLSGAIFGMAEKMFYTDVSFPFTYGPHLWFAHFFPDALGVYVYSQAFGYIGHAAATGLIGMTIGLGLFLRQKVASAKSWWWALPAAGYIWVSLEHAFNNNYCANSDDIWLILGGGQITPYIFLILLFIGLFIDWLGLYRYLKTAPKIYHGVMKKIKQMPALIKKDLPKAVRTVWSLCWFWRLVNYFSLKQEHA